MSWAQIGQKPANLLANRRIGAACDLRGKNSTQNGIKPSKYIVIRAMEPANKNGPFLIKKVRVYPRSD